MSVYEAGGDPNVDVTAKAGTAGSYGGVGQSEYEAAQGMAEGGTTDSSRIYDYLMGRGPNPMQFTRASSPQTNAPPQVDYNAYMPKPITPTTPILEEVYDQYGNRSGGMDAEGREAQRLAREAQMDKLRAELGEEGYAKRNDWMGDMINNSTLGVAAKLLGKGINKVQTFYRENELKDIYAKEAEAEAARKQKEIFGDIQLGNQNIYGPQVVGRTAPVTPSSEEQQQKIADTDFTGMDRNDRAGTSNRDASGDTGGFSQGSGREGQHAGGSGFSPGYGSQGQHAAAHGGYLQHGQFDQHMAHGGIANLHQYNLGSYSDGGRLLKGPGDGVSDSIPATIGRGQPARLADGEFVIPARIVSELGNGSTDAGARALYKMMDRIQAGRRKTVGKDQVAKNSKSARHLPA